MGWTWGPKPQSVTEWFKDYLAMDNERISRKVLATCIRLTEGYAAVEEIEKETGKRRVWCAAFMFRYCRDAYYNFGYKDMDESEGPCISNCPERILKLLTATPHKWAREWREKCWERIESRKKRPKYRVNDTLDFSNDPIPLNGGRIVRQCVCTNKRRHYFRTIPGNFLVKIPDWVFEFHTYTVKGV